MFVKIDFLLSCQPTRFPDCCCNSSLDPFCLEVIHLYLFFRIFLKKIIQCATPALSSSRQDMIVSHFDNKLESNKS